MTRTALFLSPHFDDVAFSCGGLAAVLHDQGWRTVLATAFTASVLPPTGFALECQLDKGLDASVDYMALRCQEDRVAAAILGFDERHDLGLPEAPHRGYHCASALFGPLREDDRIGEPLAELLTALEQRLGPAVVLAPQSLGQHVDHRQMVLAVQYGIQAPVCWYRDTPYVIREPGALPPAPLASLRQVVVGIDRSIDRKLDAACAYGSQIGFQFGGAEATVAALRDLASAEAGDAGGAAERFLVHDLASGALGALPLERVG